MTAGNIEIQERVIEFLQRLERKKNVSGYFLGFRSGKSVTVVGCAKHQADGTPDQFKLAEQKLCGGLHVVGYYYVSSKDTTIENVEKEVANLSNFESFIQTHEILICAMSIKDSDFENNFFWLNEEINPVSVNATSEDILSTKDFIRIFTCFSLDLELSNQEALWKNNVVAAVNDIKSSVCSSSCVFHLRNSQVLLSDSGTCGIAEESKVTKLIEYVNNEEEYGKKRKKKSCFPETTDFSLFFQISNQSDENTPSYSPVVRHSQVNFQSVSMRIPIDCLLVVDENESVGNLYPLMREAVSRQLLSVEACILQMSNIKKELYAVPSTFHFRLSDFQMYITLVYPKNMTDSDLVGTRKSIHDLFYLPMNRPCVRRKNAAMFAEDVNSYGYIINPHDGLSGSGLKGGKEYLVSGLYSYHHYMQDRFDDNKWGCAYRSLQTLISWFKLQGYTDVAMPTHREIQQILVDIGDKEPKFVGSRQWIGSMEVSYCLENLLNVSSKIMFVSSGAELASKGRELASHFLTQGTPIMIGGGVLAHTILGVDFDDVTGDVRFLILDPHYTGAEDLKVILNKGWCGWKGPEFWDQNAHYNLCMPQRPVEI